jgi:hypothetical protein
MRPAPASAFLLRMAARTAGPEGIECAPHRPDILSRIHAAGTEAARWHMKKK